MNDLHVLPKVRDSWSYLYVEHCRVDQEAKAIALHDAGGKAPVPCATLSLLMLGPGTSITHAAIRAAYALPLSCHERGALDRSPGDGRFP